jgi:hypothetical protein
VVTERTFSAPAGVADHLAGDAGVNRADDVGRGHF